MWGPVPIEQIDPIGYGRRWTNWKQQLLLEEVDDPGADSSVFVFKDKRIGAHHNVPWKPEGHALFCHHYLVAAHNRITWVPFLNQDLPEVGDVGVLSEPRQKCLSITRVPFVQAVRFIPSIN